MTGGLYIWQNDSVDYAEEQSMEIEAMQAVFMDDFECTVYLCVSHG